MPVPFIVGGFEKETREIREKNGEGKDKQEVILEMDPIFLGDHMHLVIFATSSC